MGKKQETYLEHILGKSNKSIINIKTCCEKREGMNLTTCNKRDHTYKYKFK